MQNQSWIKRYVRSGIQLLQPLLENLGLPPRSEDAEVFHLVDRIESLVRVPGKALHVHGDTVDDGIVMQHGFGDPFSPTFAFNSS